MILQRETPSAVRSAPFSRETRPSDGASPTKKRHDALKTLPPPRSSPYAQTLRCPSAAISSTLSVSTSPVAYRTFAVRARWFRDTTSALYHMPSSGQYSCFARFAGARRGRGRRGEFAFHGRSVSGRLTKQSKGKGTNARNRKKKSLKAAWGSTDREPPRGGLNRRFFPFQKDRPNRPRKASFLAGEPPL